MNSKIPAKSRQTYPLLNWENLPLSPASHIPLYQPSPYFKCAAAHPGALIYYSPYPHPSLCPDRGHITHSKGEVVQLDRAPWAERRNLDKRNGEVCYPRRIPEVNIFGVCQCFVWEREEGFSGGNLQVLRATQVPRAPWRERSLGTDM